MIDHNEKYFGVLCALKQYKQKRDIAESCSDVEAANKANQDLKHMRGDFSRIVDILDEEYDKKVEAYDKARKRVIMAYADHITGTTYVLCDALTDIAIQIKKEIEEIKQIRDKIVNVLYLPEL